MALNLLPVDIYPVMNKLVRQATGQEAISVVDGTSFAQAGEYVLQNSTMENIYHSLGIVLGETFFADRKYSARFRLISSTRDEFTARWRKISFLSRENEPTGAFNTQLYDSNLKDGVDNTGAGTEGQSGARTASMWKQNPAIPVQVEFGGTKTLETSATIYEKQIKIALRNESEFAQFVSAIMIEKGNDIESNKEAENAFLVSNFIASTYAMGLPGTVINLTADFNDTYGTNYTTAELLSTYQSDFLAYFVSVVKLTSDYMTLRSAKYHLDPSKTVNGVEHHLLRFTPKDKQKLMLYQPLFVRAQSKVFPEIFHENYLKIENYEPVMYWQSIDAPEKIKIKPNVIDTTKSSPTYLQNKAGSNVELDMVVGIMFDEDALSVNYQLDTVAESPLEAKKLYRNMIWHWAKNYCMDHSENHVIFIMKDE